MLLLYNRITYIQLFYNLGCMDILLANSATISIILYPMNLTVIHRIVFNFHASVGYYNLAHLKRKVRERKRNERKKAHNFTLRACARSVGLEKKLPLSY